MPAMRSRLSLWSLTVSLAIVGSQVAHVLTYRLVAPNADERAHLLADTGHAYMARLPLALAICSVVALLALIGQARGTRAGRATGPAAWQFALIAPLVFCCQEHFERLLHDGSFPWDAAFQPTFLLGLALQLPFALAAYLLARLLLRAAAALTALLQRPSRRLLPALLVACRPVERDARGRIAATGFAPRGPPVLCLA
jgi:hypothetical protein